MYGRISNNYNRVAVETADQKTLILICYDEALCALHMGKNYFFSKKFEEKARQFNRAQDFISELLSSLNPEAGGAIAQNLSNIYRFLLHEIFRADLKGDMKIIDQLIAILSELRSAWAQIDTRPATGLAYSKNQVLPEAARGFAV